jgi:hypothetical protein
MNAVLLRFCVLAVAGWIHRGQQDVIEYLLAENRVLREQLGGRHLDPTGELVQNIAANGGTKTGTRIPSNAHCKAIDRVLD